MANNEQVIGSLILKLSADISALTPGLKKAEGQIQSFVGGLSSTLLPMMGKIAAATAAALGAGGFVSAITGAREFAAEMSRTAEKIGVPVELLSVLSDAADKAGLSTQSLAQGLKFLSRNMFEASQGTGAAKAIFEELGVAFKNTDGTLRPVQEVLLDLVGKFSAMEDGAGKTAISLKFFGRAGQEMIPFMNQGTDAIGEFIKSAKEMGLLIDADTGKKARLLGMTFKEIGDAVKGLAIGIMKFLLPSMQGAADSALGVATYINTLRLRLNEIGEVLRYVGAVALPLIVVQLGSMVSAVGLANIAVKAFGATITFFSGPIGWISAALAGLAVAWQYLGKGTREAAAEHERFLATIGRMKPEDLQKDLVVMQNALVTTQRFIAEKQKEIEEEGPSLSRGKELDELLKWEEEAKSRIAAIQKLQDAVTQKKTPAPFVPDDKMMAALKDKASALRAEFVAFQDPVAGASAAIEDFIRKTVGDAPKGIKAIEEAVSRVRTAFAALFAAQQARANLAATEKGTFAVSVAGWEAYGQDLQRQFDNGLVDIASFFSERRRLIEAQNAAEILLLQAERGRKETTPARRIEIDAEIIVKGIKQDASIKAEAASETAAWRTLGETNLDFEQRLAEAQGRVLEGKRAALALEMQTYEVGLRGRGVSAEDAKKQTEELFVAKTKEMEFNEQLRKFGIEQADLDIRKQKINDDLAVGIGDQFTAEEKILALEKDRIPILQKMADEAMRLANESGRPELVQQAQGLNAAVRQLSIDTDESGRMWGDFKKGAQDALVSGFANFLSRGITEAKNFGEAVRTMAGNFAQAMADMIARMLAFMAISAMFKALGIEMPAMKDGGPVGSAGADGNFGAGIPKASGGLIRGPGTGTSDSILARLSAGEFVVKAAAVRKYGTEFLYAINQTILPRSEPRFAFAAGGLVGGGGGGGGTTTLDSSLTVGLDRGLILQEMETPAGQRLLVKLIEKNKRAVRSVIGG
jgi:hypothetical protein